MSGRTLAIGDIHGCHVALDVLLANVAPAGDDTVVVLGDVIDRGPGSKQVIDRLIELRETSRLVFILGNHEEMLLAILDGKGWVEAWLSFGGRETLDSYGGELEMIPPEHVAFVRSGLPYWETETEIFVHANLEPGVPLERQRAEWLLGKKLTGSEEPHPSGKRVICGHTPISTGLPAVFDGWVDIDTGAYRGLYLTCLEVETGRLFQARQTGEFRGGLTLADLT